MAAKIKKGDKVVVLAGKDRGKTGEVKKVYPTEARVTVEGVNLVKRHRKPTQFAAGGIDTFEAPIAISNVAYMNPSDGKPARVGFKVLDDGRKVRVLKGSGEVIDV
jgi:large subunit ribosomal protein L24